MRELRLFDARVDSPEGLGSIREFAGQDAPSYHTKYGVNLFKQVVIDCITLGPNVKDADSVAIHFTYETSEMDNQAERESGEFSSRVREPRTPYR